MKNHHNATALFKNVSPSLFSSTPVWPDVMGKVLKDSSRGFEGKITAQSSWDYDSQALYVVATSENGSKRRYTLNPTPTPLADGSSIFWLNNASSALVVIAEK